VTNDHEDEELRTSFSTLRQEDAHATPSFQALVDGARSHPTMVVRRFAWRKLRALTAAAAIIVIALVAAREIARRARPRASTLATAASITTWTSPTRGLLRTSSRELLAPSPVLRSVLGDITPLPVPRKGD
jgi:hypothetical protein